MNIIFDIYSIFDIKINNYSYVFIHIEEDENTFFERKKNSLQNLYTESLFYIASLEKISLYLRNSKLNWIKVKIKPYIDIPFDVYEYFFFIVEQNIYNSYCLYKNDKFTINESIYNLNEDILNEIYYNKYNVIEIGYNYIINNLIRTHPSLLSMFKGISKDNNNRSNIIIFIYVIIVFIMSGLFYFTIEYEKRRMSNGIKKISKISYEKIKLMLKKLKKFKEFYNMKFQINSLIDFRLEHNHFDNNENFLDYKSFDETIKDSIIKNNNEKDKNNFDNIEFNIEKKEIIKLKLMTEVNYLILLIVSITIFSLFSLALNINKLIKSQNELMESESYLLEIFIKLNVQIIQTKCLITDCKNTTYYNTDNIINVTYYKTLIKTTEKFSELNDFYYNRFNQDYCLTMSEKDSDEYKKCKEISNMNQNQINSTTGLIAVAEDIIHSIYNIYLYNLEKDNTYSGYEIFIIYQYDYITYINDNFLMTVIPFIDKVVRNCFNAIISEKKHISYLLLSALLLISIAHYIFDLNYLLPKLMKYVKISKNFIQIIPSNLIFQTVELENYIDALDNNNKNK
jgi:hypothetical protein